MGLACNAPRGLGPACHRHQQSSRSSYTLVHKPISTHSNPRRHPAVKAAHRTEYAHKAALSAVGAAVTLALQLNCPTEALAGPQSTPYTEAKNVTFGVLNGRIQACPTNINPNCVSTSSTNQAYSPVWRAKAKDAKSALLDIEAVMVGSKLSATKLIEAETPYGWYSAYSVQGKFSKPDVVEFLVKDDGATDTARDADKAPVVFYRSIAGDVKYIWPITQAVTDLDTQKKRMQTVRRELGWNLVGCELVECYDEESSNQQFKLY